MTETHLQNSDILKDFDELLTELIVKFVMPCLNRDYCPKDNDAGGKLKSFLSQALTRKDEEFIKMCEGLKKPSPKYITYKEKETELIPASNADFNEALDLIISKVKK